MTSSDLRLLPLRERPAYRVAEVGANVCSLAELLAVVVGGARQIEVAHALLSRFGDLDGLMMATPQELEDVPGVGSVGAARLKAALELGRRRLLAAADECFTVRSPADVAQLLMAEMSHLEQEQLRVLCLNVRNRLIGDDVVYTGGLSIINVRIGEVFRGATRRNSAAIIVAHTHPSGDPTPSPEDVNVTRQLVAAGNLLGIEVLDHIIVSKGNRFVSLRERGLGWTA